MIGFNILGMIWNAWYRDDIPDQRRIRYIFGILTPNDSTITGAVDYNEALSLMWGNRNPLKIWHRTKHIVVEWTRMSNNRAAKVGMDLVFWAFIAGWLLG